MAVVYAVVVVVDSVLVFGACVYAVVASVRAQGSSRGAEPRKVPDVSEAAFLAGGPQRVADTAIVTMHAEGRLFVSDLGWVAVTDARPGNALEEALTALCPQPRRRALTELRRELMRSAPVQDIGERLAARGLLVRPERARARRTARWLLRAAMAVGPAAALWVLVAQGPARWAATLPFLAGTALCAAVAAGIHRSGAPGRLTRVGQKVLDAHGPGESTTERVALLGAPAVADRRLRRLLRRHVASVTAFAVYENSVAWCGAADPGLGWSDSASDSASSDGGFGGGWGSCGSGSGCGGGGGGCGSS